MSDNDVTGYEAINFDGLERRGNYRLIAFREDILRTLDKKEGAAIIYEIVSRWQWHKRNDVLKKIDARKKAGLKPFTEEEVEDMMFVYMSYNDFVRESGGALGYNTVIRLLKYLIEDKKVLLQRENHDPRHGDYEYSINKDVVRKLLKSLPIDPAFAPKIPKKKIGSTQMGIPTDSSTQMGTPAQDSTQMGIGSTQMGIEVYPFGGTSQESTKTHKNEGTNATADSTNPNASLSFPPSFFSLSPEEQLAYLENQAACIRQTMDAKETASSSKPSDDPTLSTELPTGVDNGQAAASADASLIVIDATSNRPEKAAPAQVESMTTRNTSNETNTAFNDALDPERRRIAGYLEELEFDFDLTPLNKQHLTKLAKRVKSVEQMKSLKAFTENQELLKGKTIYLGNLANANNLNGWRQSEQAKQRAEVQKSAPASPSKLTSVSGMRNYSVDPEVQPVIAETERKLPVFKLKSREKRETIAQ